MCPGSAQFQKMFSCVNCNWIVDEAGKMVSVSIGIWIVDASDH